jgi:hypothetical protein
MCDLVPLLQLNLRNAVFHFLSKKAKIPIDRI